MKKDARERKGTPKAPPLEKAQIPGGRNQSQNGLSKFVLMLHPARSDAVLLTVWTNTTDIYEIPHSMPSPASDPVERCLAKN